MANVKSDMLYANVSAVASAGDGIAYDVITPQPPVLQTGNVGVSAAGVSAPQYNMLEFIRRAFTHIDTPSATLVTGTSGYAVAVTIGQQYGSGGIGGKLQGVPFYISGVGHLSAQLTSAASTASNQIRKVLVCIGLSSLPMVSSMASGAGTLQCTYGSAFLTSASVVTSGGTGNGPSYFDLVPLPVPSANEVPVGWLNIPNNFPVSTSVSASMLWSDYRALQGINLSAMMTGIPQP